MKFALLGAAGGIGQPLSLLLKTQLPAGSQLALYDVAPFTPGVAVDVSHIPTPVEVVGYTGDDIDKALTGADVVIITAGLARKPGMTRADLLIKNAGIVGGLVKNVAQYCPNACLAIVSNPVNTTVPLAARVLKRHGCYNPKKLFGVTILDAQRAVSFLSASQHLDPLHVSVSVIGGHSGPTILPLFSHNYGAHLTEETINELTEKVRNGGTLVVEAKAGAGSATLSMAAAAARFVGLLVRGLQGDPTATVNAFVDHELYGAEFFAQPIRFGTEGIAEYLPIGSLSKNEQKALEELLPILQKDIAAAYELDL